jgi:hypothetical protein
MTVPPDFDAWSRAVQVELDGLKRDVQNRLDDLASRVSSFVSNAEYNADKRSVDLQMTNVKDKIDDAEADVTVLKTDMIKVIDDLKRDTTAAHTRLEQMIVNETNARHQQQKEEAAARQSNFRWMISAVLIPIVLAVMDLMLNKK